MLDAQNISVSYGQHRALDGVSVKTGPGEIVVILGANGAGKSTLLKSLGGLVKCAGQVTMDGQAISGIAPHEIVERGLALVPEGRGIFGDLSVQENLTLGAYANRARADEAANLNRVLGLFPKLMERRDQTARTMSGGEQQMVAIGRALMSAPSVLMLDEPSLGLSPLLCSELFKSLRAIRDSGVGVLLVEQNARQSLAIADRAYLLENGRIVGEGSADEMMRNSAVQKAYLGGASASGHSVATHKGKEPPQQPGTHGPTGQSSGTTARDDQEAVINKALASLSKTSATGSGAVPSGDAIDAMVQRATNIQRDHIAASAPTNSSDVNTPISPSLENILADIESSAAQALAGGDDSRSTASYSNKGSQPVVHIVKPRAVSSTKTGGKSTRSGVGRTNALKIPVFKKAKIEVYRRKSADGPLERDD